MLILGSQLNQTPVMSLQTGTQLAITGDPLVNPANLQILAYKLEDSTSGAKQTELIRIADIRELSKLGFIIDSIDEFIQPTDVIKINEIYNLNFNLIDMKVIDQKNAKIGTITDFTIDLNTFTVQQLIVKRPILKSFNDPELTIHRSQITAVDDYKITIKTETEPTPKVKVKDAAPEVFTPNYVNPFRN
jgi:sporulation protein YlmC with PRC-barrel domain